MSFFGDIGKEIEGALAGGAGADMAGRLMQSIPGMDDGTKAALGQHITDALAQHQGTDAAEIADRAGTSTEAVAAGDENALQKVVAFGQQHPEVLQAATQAFSERNPQALAQFAPELLNFFKPR